MQSLSDITPQQIMDQQTSQIQTFDKKKYPKKEAFLKVEKTIFTLKRQLQLLQQTFGARSISDYLERAEKARQLTQIIMNELAFVLQMVVEEFTCAKLFMKSLSLLNSIHQMDVQFFILQIERLRAPQKKKNPQPIFLPSPPNALDSREGSPNRRLIKPTFKGKHSKGNQKKDQSLNNSNNSGNKHDYAASQKESQDSTAIYQQQLLAINSKYEELYELNIAQERENLKVRERTKILREMLGIDIANKIIDLEDDEIMKEQREIEKKQIFSQAKEYTKIMNDPASNTILENIFDPKLIIEINKQTQDQMLKDSAVNLQSIHSYIAILNGPQHDKNNDNESDSTFKQLTQVQQVLEKSSNNRKQHFIPESAFMKYKVEEVLNTLETGLYDKIGKTQKELIVRMFQVWEEIQLARKRDMKVGTQLCDSNWNQNIEDEMKQIFKSRKDDFESKIKDYKNKEKSMKTSLISKEKENEVLHQKIESMYKELQKTNMDLFDQRVAADRAENQKKLTDKNIEWYQQQLKDKEASISNNKMQVANAEHQAQDNKLVSQKQYQYQIMMLQLSIQKKDFLIQKYKQKIIDEELDFNPEDGADFQMMESEHKGLLQGLLKGVNMRLQQNIIQQTRKNLKSMEEDIKGFVDQLVVPGMASGPQNSLNDDLSPAYKNKDLELLKKQSMRSIASSAKNHPKNKIQQSKVKDVNPRTHQQKAQTFQKSNGQQKPNFISQQKKSIKLDNQIEKSQNSYNNFKSKYQDYQDNDDNRSRRSYHTRVSIKTDKLSNLNITNKSHSNQKGNQLKKSQFRQSQHSHITDQQSQRSDQSKDSIVIKSKRQLKGNHRSNQVSNQSSSQNIKNNSGDFTQQNHIKLKGSREKTDFKNLKVTEYSSRNQSQEDDSQEDYIQTKQQVNNLKTQNSPENKQLGNSKPTFSQRGIIIKDYAKAKREDIQRKLDEKALKKAQKQAEKDRREVERIQQEEALKNINLEEINGIVQNKQKDLQAKIIDLKQLQLQKRKNASEATSVKDTIKLMEGILHFQALMEKKKFFGPKNLKEKSNKFKSGQYQIVQEDQSLGQQNFKLRNDQNRSLVDDKLKYKKNQNFVNKKQSGYLYQQSDSVLDKNKNPKALLDGTALGHLQKFNLDDQLHSDKNLRYTTKKFLDEQGQLEFQKQLFWNTKNASLNGQGSQYVMDAIKDPEMAKQLISQAMMVLQDSESNNQQGGQSQLTLQQQQEIVEEFMKFQKEKALRKQNLIKQQGNIKTGLTQQFYLNQDKSLNASNEPVTQQTLYKQLGPSNKKLSYHAKSQSIGNLKSFQSSYQNNQTFNATQTQTNFGGMNNSRANFRRNSFTNPQQQQLYRQPGYSKQKVVPDQSLNLLPGSSIPTSNNITQNNFNKAKNDLTQEQLQALKAEYENYEKEERNFNKDLMMGKDYSVLFRQIEDQYQQQNFEASKLNFLKAQTVYYSLHSLQKNKQIHDKLNPLVNDKGNEFNFIRGLYTFCQTNFDKQIKLVAVKIGKGQKEQKMTKWDKFLKFREVFNNWMNDHKSCGPRCPHLARFYTQLGIFDARNVPQNKTEIHLPKVSVDKNARKDIEGQMSAQKKKDHLQKLLRNL